MFATKNLGVNIKSGITVALISVPLAISLAIVGGASPVMWLLSGAWSWILAAFLCSSKHNAYGPAGSLAGILLPVAMTYGIQYFPVLAIIAGIAIVLFGVFRLTKYLALIPWPALQWFLLGIWLIIWLQQVPAILWLDVSLGAWESLQYIQNTNFLAVGIFLGTLAIMRLWRKYIPSIPGAIIVTVLGVLIGRYTSAQWISLDLLMHEYVWVHFSIYQGLDRSLLWSMLSDMTLLKTMLIAGVWVGIIAILETLISAKVAMKQTWIAYDPQREVYGLGITNMLTGIVGWMPISALVPRTSMNIMSGATSRLSGWLVWLFTWLFAAFLFTDALQYLPFAVIAGILVDIALSMINISLYHKMRKLEKISIIIILLVWLISYAWDPMLGILLGTVIALLLVVKRSFSAELMANVFRNGHHIHKIPLSHYSTLAKSWDILLIKMEGEMNYLTVESHIMSMKTVDEATTIILWFGYTAVLDTDAFEEIERMMQVWLDQGKDIYITWLREHNAYVLEQGSVYHELKTQGRIYESKTVLLEKLLDK